MEMISNPIHNRMKRVTPPPGPFGYFLLSPRDTPFDFAPEPPSGPALLDDSESNMLDNFFTTLNASHLDSNDFWLSFNDHDNGESGLGFDWTDLPPNFEGSATTLPSHPTLSHKPARDAIITDKPGVLSSDILAAAQMLYQNGNDFFATFNNQMYTENGVLDVDGIFSNNIHNNTNTGIKHVGTRFDGSDDPNRSPMFNAPQKDLTYMNKGVHANKMVFDHEAQTILGEQPASGKPGTLQWGSDSRFADQGYHVPPDQPSYDETTSSLLHNLECLEAQSSNTNTRQSSPTKRLSDRSADLQSYAESGVAKSQHVADNEPPKKRRKSNNKIKEEDSEPEYLARNYRNIKETSTSPRKKSTGTGGFKSSRENLTEEQKRTNHILSEQKRRNIIKQGFDDLCVLVPELKGGGYSKSTMLTQAGDWLEELLHGNELLKVQLADLKVQQGG